MDLPRIRDVKDLQVLLDLMRKNDLAELEIEDEGRRIRLRKTEPRIVAERLAAHATQLPPEGAQPPLDTPREEPEDDGKVEVVTSPLVGTFYRAPSPEADPFVHEGDRVEGDSVLCIIEAMKVMNEIPANVSGIVREILVKNGDAVEFGQPLFRIEVE